MRKSTRCSQSFLLSAKIGDVDIWGQHGFRLSLKSWRCMLRFSHFVNQLIISEPQNSRPMVWAAAKYLEIKAPQSE